MFQENRGRRLTSRVGILVAACIAGLCGSSAILAGPVNETEPNSTVTTAYALDAGQYGHGSVCSTFCSSPTDFQDIWKASGAAAGDLIFVFAAGQDTQLFVAAN